MTAHQNHLNILSKWLRYRNYIDLSAVLRGRAWHNIAIYGGGYLGLVLYEYLMTTDINIKCIIDRNPDIDFPYDALIVTPQRFKETNIKADVIIVTPLDFPNIEFALKDFVNCPIVWLNALIIDIDELQVMLDAVAHIERQGARLFMIDISCPLLHIKNPSPLELNAQAHGRNGNYSDLFNPSGAKLKYLSTFYDDLPECNEEYIKGVYQTKNYPRIRRNGVFTMNDVESDYLNVINGIRYTAGNPHTYDNTIHFFGCCLSIGAFTEDKYTIESFLQGILNETPVNGKVYRVLNHIGGWRIGGIMPYVKYLDFCPGDIVIVIDNEIQAAEFYLDMGFISFHNLNSAFERPHGYGEIFFDLIHMNHRGYKIIADNIYSILNEALNTAQPERTGVLSEAALNKFLPKKPPKMSDEDAAGLDDYLTFLQDERVAVSGITGAVVMNCNPFTLGHRFLIEEAKRQCDFLYIFVLEEDKSFFSFDDRLYLVKAGTADLNNVKVIPGGRFIISSVTLPEYFNKETAPDVKIDASKDISIFMNNIAPALNIKKRFVGTEPFDPVTDQYNKALIETLPKGGIEVMEIKRLELAGNSFSPPPPPQSAPLMCVGF